MKVYVDRDELIEMLWRSDVSSREKIEEIVKKAPTFLSESGKNSRYGIGYSDGRKVQSKFYAAEKEAIRNSIDKIDHILATIADNGGTIQHSDMEALKERIDVIKDLCEKEKEY